MANGNLKYSSRLRKPLEIFVLGQVDRNGSTRSRTFVSPESCPAMAFEREDAILCTHPHSTLDATLLGMHNIRTACTHPSRLLWNIQPNQQEPSPMGLPPPDANVPQLEIHLTRSICCGQRSRQRQFLSVDRLAEIENNDGRSRTLQAPCSQLQSPLRRTDRNVTISCQPPSEPRYPTRMSCLRFFTRLFHRLLEAAVLLQQAEAGPKTRFVDQHKANIADQRSKYFKAPCRGVNGKKVQVRGIKARTIFTYTGTTATVAM